MTSMRASEFPIENAGLDKTITGRAALLPAYDTAFDYLEHLNVERDPAPGVEVVHTYLAHMSDNSQNVVRSIVPKDRKFEPPVAYTTPLGTRVNGFNTYVGYEMAQHGMAVDIIGAPQHMGGEAHLSHEAHNFAQIISHMQEVEHSNSAPIIAGMSRGGMEALGIFTYMKRLGNPVMLAIVQDPCLANGLGIIKTSRDMTLEYVTRELAEGAKGILERSDEERLASVAKHIARLGKTMSFSPQYLRTHGRIGQELWKGQAGELAASLPPEALVIMHFYKGSRFNHYQQFQELTADKPYVRTVLQDGLHLTMTRKSVTRAYVKQFVTGQEMLIAGKSPAEIADTLNYPLVNKSLSLQLVKPA